MPIIQFIKKHNQYNAQEKADMPENVAARLCGEDNPRFKVAVRVPELEGKAMAEPPEDKQVKVPEEKKEAAHVVTITDAASAQDTQPTRGRGRR